MNKWGIPIIGFLVFLIAMVFWPSDTSAVLPGATPPSQSGNTSAQPVAQTVPAGTQTVVLPIGTTIDTLIKGVTKTYVLPRNAWIEYSTQAGCLVVLLDGKVAAECGTQLAMDGHPFTMGFVSSEDTSIMLTVTKK